MPDEIINSTVRKEYDNKFIPDARFAYCIFLSNLEKAGVKFDMDDLSLDHWQLLGLFKDALNEFQIKQMKRK